ncbi:MAG: T9SS type A sorting domain-containing protein [Bacteroidota bacterium]
MKIFIPVLFFLCFTTVLYAQVVTIPDANFKSKLLQSSPSNFIAKNLTGAYFKIDANDDSEVQLSEALNVSLLQLSNDGVGTEIQSLEGITSFSNLRTLYCWYNILGNVNLNGLSNLVTIDCHESNITSLNLNGLTSLQTLSCYGNQIQSLDVHSLTSIRSLNCSANQLTSLDASNLSTLRTLSCGQNLLTSLSLDNLFNLFNLYCNYNELTTLNTSDLVQLINFYCSRNNLTSLNLTNSTTLIDLQCDNNSIGNLNLNGLSTLQKLYCWSNQLVTLDVSTLAALVDFRCSNNQLQTIDVSNLRNINILDCYNNDLRYLYLKNGRSSMTLNFGDNPNLLYACIDENLVPWIQGLTVSFGCPNCQVNSYCSFVPGGPYFLINGNSILDNGSDGCDDFDVSFPHLKINVTDGTNNGNFIANATGEYSIPAPLGTHTITPVLENPTYFNISPSSYQVTSPSTVSYNFCLTPNGSHQDLETWIIPLTPARPGFDAQYKIMYKNKGNSVMSGNVTFAFNDEYMDFVSATPIQDNQSDSLLSWNYANLNPFEVRELVVVLNINSPMEIPAVNVGDVIKFSTVIFPIVADEYTSDNANDLRQIVVGSFDPNDKFCLEGEIVQPDKIGEYVHYIIRFENTGTYAAENIVVKDMIDTNKFDMATLIPLDGSHDFETRITNGNKAEFIFENINLPFDDANNDGYVAFKIKTKPTLVVGDSFSNAASIYFDYNFPINTNSFTTTIQELGNQDFDFNGYFNLYPNPANDILNVKPTTNLLIHSTSIYNMLGQLLQVHANPDQTIDVSTLKPGNYIISIITDSGKASGRFIKN